MLNVLGLFSGIGGFELGFRRAGFAIAAMCEIEPYCRAVLAERFPGVPVYDDVRRLSAVQLHRDGIRVDVVTGGFPCQDISLAGKGAGLGGERSGLWFEYRRIVEEVRPAWVVIENVSALRSRGLDVVLGSLAALGYDAEWHCIPAAAVGAPHRRDRVWIVAHAQSDRGHGPVLAGERQTVPGLVGPGEDVAHAFGVRQLQPKGREPAERRWFGDSCAGGGTGDVPDTGRHSAERHGPRIRAVSECDFWLSEPDVGRVADGVPSRVDRLRALGNAVVPQIPELIAQAIFRSELFD